MQPFNKIFYRDARVRRIDATSKKAIGTLSKPRIRSIPNNDTKNFEPKSCLKTPIGAQNKRTFRAIPRFSSQIHHVFTHLTRKPRAHGRGAAHTRTADHTRRRKHTASPHETGRAVGGPLRCDADGKPPRRAAPAGGGGPSGQVRAGPGRWGGGDTQSNWARLCWKPGKSAGFKPGYAAAPQRRNSAVARAAGRMSKCSCQLSGL